MYSRVSNRRGGWNKSGGCQISAKMISGEASKNTAIINFIKPEPVYAYKRNAYKKKHVHQIVLWLCLGFTLPLSTVHMN